VSALVDQAIHEEGHLDVFFANAGIIQRPPKRVAGGGDEIVEELKATGRNMGGIEDTEFMEVLRINTLRWIDQMLSGYLPVLDGVRRKLWGRLACR
jgi:NAD(P)-dependent dehydrogenase (short-subunit alcohol dehydrogenase family)